MKSKMRRLIIQLNEASREYYNGLKCSMTDLQWDKGFDDLVKLEKETGVTLSNSPTQRAGYQIVDGLNKIKHSTPLLSLGKTKSIDDLLKFLGDKSGVLMFKLDGGTQIANYKDFTLSYLATRGSSSTNEGQDITHNASAIIGIPKNSGKEHIQVIGEGIMLKSKFEEINSKLLDEDKYANARNLANATSSMLDANRVAKREIRFIAFGALENSSFHTKIEELNYLNICGFDVVEHVFVTKNNLKQEIERMTEKADLLDYLVDGLVLAHNDIDYGMSLGKTSHHFNNAYALKWSDESVTTTLRDIELNIGKSGQLSYTAIFDSVELEGTDVGRATLHNWDRIQELELGIGDKITTCKANKIIPQVLDNLTRSGTYKKVELCPICGSKLVHKETTDGDSVHQFCVNYDCERQIVGRLVHWCSRDAMNIDGVSEETIKKIRDDRIPLNDVSDFYYLYTYKDALSALDGFGKRKVDKLLDEIEKSKTRPLSNVLYGLSIPSVGRTASKKLAEWLGDTQEIINGNPMIGAARCIVGNSIGGNFFNYMTKEGGLLLLTTLVELGLTMIQPEEQTNGKMLEGLTFVLTGKVEKFANRKEIQAYIESNGGKVTGSVSKNTSYLVNNDVHSVTGKNKKAKELGVQVMSEAQLILKVESTGK